MGLLKQITLALLGTLILALSAALSIARTQTPQSPGILFMSERTGDAEIYRMRPDGTHQFRLTYRPGRDGAPIPNPSGGTAIFSSKEGRIWNLIQISLFGHTQRPVIRLSTLLKDPAMSPDGETIFFAVTFREKVGPVSTAIAAVHPATDEFRLMADTETQKTRLSLSPDGQWLVYAVPQNGLIDELHLMRTDGTQMSQLMQATAFSAATWTPDSRTLLVVTADAGNWDIQQVVLGTDQIAHVMNSTAYEWNPHVSPDGQWLVFQSDRDGNTEIYRMPLTGGDVERLTEDAGEDYIAEFSPDGQWILYTNNPDGPDGHTPDVWKMRLDGTQRTRLTFAEGVDTAPAWLPIHNLPFAGVGFVALGLLMVGSMGWRLTR